MRRIKTYSAQSGYVYQYCFRGYRRAEEHGGATEFCFEVSADRRTQQEARVFVADAAVRQWEEGHGRELAGNERYAVAKMSLLQAFDEREPGRMAEPVRVRATDLDAIISNLGLD